MSLGLLGEYGSDSSEEEGSPQHTDTTPTKLPSSKTVPSSRPPHSKSADSVVSSSTDPEHDTHYDPFGFSTPLDEIDTSSSESNQTDENESPPGQDDCLPLPDLDTLLHGPEKKSGSSVFSNPYRDAEEERLAILKHHVKEFAPEFKEDKRRQRRGRGRGRRGSRRQTQPSGALFDDDDASTSKAEQLGRRKARSGVGDSLLPPKKFMKTHSQLQAQEKPWQL